ncbi:hypothetical protein ACFY2M_42735 [Streptomyces sp. NPDC001276]
MFWEYVDEGEMFEDAASAGRWLVSVLDPVACTLASLSAPPW